jgi:hypothetical protein
MGTTICTLVKVPVEEIVEWLKTNHNLPSTLEKYCLEDNNLVLYFGGNESSNETLSTPDKNINDTPASSGGKHRRAQKKRNRMRTRGWDVIARITNSKGQKCAIYKPFFEALSDQTLSSEQQKKKVESILKANRNRPSEESIHYFLDNTLEFLNTPKQQEV